MPINNLICSILTLHLPLADGTWIINGAQVLSGNISDVCLHQHWCLHGHSRALISSWPHAWSSPRCLSLMRTTEKWRKGNADSNRSRRLKLRNQEASFIWPPGSPMLKALLATYSQECYCYAVTLTKEIISERKSIHIWRQSCYRDHRTDGAFG